MSRERSRTERLAGLALAVLLAGSTVVVPLLHAGEVDREAAYTDTRPPATSSLLHDHAVCVQLQTSSARPATPLAAPPVPTRDGGRLGLRLTSVTSCDGRRLPRARSPPRRLPL